MKTILNTTRRALTIRLSRGKVLRLGPGKEGQVTTQDADRESVKMLLADGDIKVVDEGSHAGSGAGATAAGRSNTRGHNASFGVMKHGDR